MIANTDEKISDICNALQAIILNIHLLKGDLKAQEIENRRLQIIYNSANRIDKALKELYYFIK